MIRVVGPWEEPKLVITEVTDPEELALARKVHEQALRNSEWLQAHWGDLEHARGRFVAVAGQQAFVADTIEEAVALARASHPEDQGLLAQFVPPWKGPRIYAHRWDHE